MNSSSFFRKTPVKVIAAIVLFVIFASAISLAVYLPNEKVYASGNSYTLAFVGGSIFTRGVDPSVIDEKTGQDSYVLASKGSPLYGRYDMLHAALDEIDTIREVVIEVSYYTLVKPIGDYSLEERLLFFPKVTGLKNKYLTARKDFSFMADEYDQMYAQLLYDGMESWKEIFTGKYQKQLNRKGFDPYIARDQAISSATEAEKTKNSRKMSTKFVPKSIEDLRAMITLCQSKGIAVTIIALPMSQTFVWQTTGMDKYRKTMQKIAQEYGIDYYDFNLLEDIGSYFDDATSYHDEEHLSRKGAPAFSTILGEILAARQNGQPLPYRFYDSYAEAKKYSVYAAMK